MKRDMDLVRDIMSALEESARPIDASAFADERHDFQCVAYHLMIMQQGGLIGASCQMVRGGTFTSASADYLTWEGQEFLAAVKDGKVWSQVKREAAMKAVGVPFSLLSKLALKALEAAF